MITLWTDPTLVPKQTGIKAQHVMEIRAAVNNLEAGMGGDLDVFKSTKDTYGIYTVVDFKRKDGTKYMRSTLATPSNSVYTRCIWQFYNTNDVEIPLEAVTWILTYDASNIIVQATGNSGKPRNFNILGVLVYHGVNAGGSMIFKGPTAPSAPTEGTWWYDTVKAALNIYIDGSWKAAGGGGIGLQLTNTVITSAACSTINIGIPGFNKDRDLLEVIKNTTTLNVGDDYTVTNTAITRTDTTGMWEAGARFTFIVRQNVNSNGDKLQLVCLTSSYMATDTTQTPAINQPLFNKNTDVLNVFYEGAKLHAGVHYTISSDSTTLSLLGWSLLPNKAIYYEMWKNVTVVYGGIDGGTISNYSITSNKIQNGAIGNQQIADGSVNSNKMDTVFLGTLEKIASKNLPNGYPGLDASGLLNVSVVPVTVNVDDINCKIYMGVR